MLLFLVIPLRVVAQDSEPEPISTRTGVYTTDQADLGQELFGVVCGECHQPAEFAKDFLDGWSGQTVDELFGEIRSTMPEDSPGSLKSSEYAAVIAFLFRLNGLAEGKVKLPSSTRRLKGILIEAPVAEEEDDKGPRN